MGRSDGRIAVVTGAGQGIGQGCAFALAAEGATIVAVDLDAENASATAAEIVGRGGRAVAAPCDVRDVERVQAVVADTVADYGGVDILVNAAIHAFPVIGFEETTAHWMDLGWQVGVMGPFHFMQACFPVMRDRAWGRVVNFGSGAGLDGAPGYACYGPIKEAVRSLTRIAAREWGKYGITANSVCPFAKSGGFVRWSEHYPEQAAMAAAGTVVGRVGDCELDIGRAVAFLASEEASYVTGHTLMVDGGQSRP